MKTTIYYSVQNGGDGSAYPTFMESQKLAGWDQEHMDEGWGESCDGSIEIESDSPIFCKDVVTETGYLLNLVLEEDELAEEFYNDFFTEFPEFEIIKGEKSKKYQYLHFLQNGKEVYKYFTGDTIQRTIVVINNFKEKVTNAV